MIILIQQQLIPLYTTRCNTRYAIWLSIQQQIYDMTLRILFMNKATARPLLEDPPPMRIPGAARRTPRHYPRLWISCYYIDFFLFCHLCYSISTIRRPISREDAHRMYPRYPRVFLYVIIYCPLPHQSLWERLGVSLSCTCAAFSPLC